MSTMERGQYPMSLIVERGAARVRVTDSGSPSRASHEDSQVLRDRITLRSHDQASSPPSSSSVGESPPQPSFSRETEGPENMSEATTEIANPHDITFSPPEPPHPTSPEDNTEDTFLNPPPSPVRNESRIWECHVPTEADFLIWEDPSDQETPLSLTPLAYPDIDDDKENTYATVSDYDSPEHTPEPEVRRIDWTWIHAGPHDVFGLPVDTPFAAAPPNLPGSSVVSPHVVPTASDANVRPATRAILRDEEESEEEWDDSLSTAQVRELQELRDMYGRGVEDRLHHSGHFPMRDFNVQGQANILLEVRRITEFQRHQGRRRSGGEDDEG